MLKDIEGTVCPYTRGQAKKVKGYELIGGDYIPQRGIQDLRKKD